MRAFVLGAGRCGTLATSKAFGHARNYGVGHESNWGRIEARLEYSDDHIEVDNRLLWLVSPRHLRTPPLLLGRRDEEAWARSLAKRHLLDAYAQLVGVKATGLGQSTLAVRKELARELIDTVHERLVWLCPGRPVQENGRIWFCIEDYAEWFPSYWKGWHCVGDLDAAMAEFSKGWNATLQGLEKQPAKIQEF